MHVEGKILNNLTFNFTQPQNQKRNALKLFSTTVYNATAHLECTYIIIYISLSLTWLQ